MDNSDFVFTQSTDENGNKIIIGGGYKIDSYFLKEEQPIMTTYNTPEDEQQNGGKKVTSPFENLAVPAGIFYINQKTEKPKNIKTHYDENHSMLPEDIYDKLLGLVQPSQSKNKINKINKKTRKYNDKPVSNEKNSNEKITKKRKTRRTSK
jgi:hypothetical protein